jgi:hypothetical protein
MGGKSSKRPSFTRSETTLTCAKKEVLTELSLGKKKSIELSKELIDFNLGEEACPLNEPVFDSFTITNESGKRVKFSFDPIPAYTYSISFQPSSGTLDCKEKKNSKLIKVQLTLMSAESLNFRVNLRINGGETLFLTVRTHSEQGIYGVDPTSLESVEDGGFEVPAVLAQMKGYLIEQDALTQEGIFRLAGDASEMKRLKQIMNKNKTFEGIETDVNTVANLLKVWYRDLPTPILNVLPTETIFSSGDPNVCIEAYENLPEPQKSLFGWLLSLLADVAGLKAKNKMSEQNLAIVVAPNLYDPPSSDPMEGLVMSQKAVQFLHNMILNELEVRSK